MHLLLKVDREDPDHKNQILDLEAGQILVKSDQQDYRPILKIRWRRPSWRPTRSGPGPKSSEQSPKTLVHLHCPTHHVSFKGRRIDGWLTLCQTAPPLFTLFLLASGPPMRKVLENREREGDDSGRNKAEATRGAHWRAADDSLLPISCRWGHELDGHFDGE